MKYINFEEGEEVRIISCSYANGSYTHLIGKIGTVDYTGPRRENDIMHLSNNKWGKNFYVKDLQIINPKTIDYEAY